MSRIAVVGSGIAGLSSAYLLSPQHQVTLFEADDRLGGHSNTVTVDDPAAGELGIDTGFIVHNDRNYPLLVRLFDELGVATQPTEMSFGVTDRDPGSSTNGFTYRATNLNTLFADRRNLIRPTMWRMLVDIGRFYRRAQRFLAEPDDTLTIADFLDQGGYGREFIDLHLVPMGAAVWSADPAAFREFPALTLLRFLDHHGLLSIGNRPQWRTVVGGSQVYVAAIARQLETRGALVRAMSPVARVERVPDGGVDVTVAGGGTERFDRVIIAAHSDQALAMLADPTAHESRVLKAIRYQPNRATLHTDTSLMPPQRRAWAAWNYDRIDDATLATLTYDLTALQRLGGERRYLVSLNSDDRIDPAQVLASFDYDHPVFDHRAVDAQRELADADPADVDIQCIGAWCGYGFHEDGIAAAVRACRRLGVEWEQR